MSNESSETPPTPALYLHAVKAYELMEAEATEVQFDDGEPAMLWTGHLTKLIASQLHLSTPYYTGVVRALKRMGCIRQIKRGGGTAESEWEIIKPPTPELWAKLDRKSARLYASQVSATEQLTAMVADLQKRVNRLEKALDIPLGG
jgi:hypothetical protein